MHFFYFLGSPSIELGDQLTYITLNKEMHSIERSGPSRIWKLRLVENFKPMCLISAPIAVQDVTQLPFWGRWQCSHKCHLEMALGRLPDGSSACPLSAGLQILSHRRKVQEKRVCCGWKNFSYHTECHVGVHINARMRQARELYAHQCQQLCANLKTNKKESYHMKN